VRNLYACEVGTLKTELCIQETFLSLRTLVRSLTRPVNIYLRVPIRPWKVDPCRPLRTIELSEKLPLIVPVTGMLEVLNFQAISMLCTP
jgi:hypothetical protein